MSARERRPGWLALIALAMCLLGFAGAVLVLVTGAAAGPLALATVFVLPGATIVTAAWAGRRLDPAARLMLTVAASLASVVVATPLLNATPYGLGGRTWAAAILLVSVTALFVWLARLSGWRWIAERAAGWPARLRAERRYWPTLNTVLAYAIAFFVLLTAIGLSRSAAARQLEAPALEMWTLPAFDPTDAEALPAVALGILNVTGRDLVCDVTVGFEGTEGLSWVGEPVAHGQTWEQLVEVPIFDVTGTVVDVLADCAADGETVSRSTRILIQPGDDGG